MARPIPLAGGGFFTPSAPLAVGLFISVFALIALCARHGVARKHNQKHDMVERSSSGELSAGEEAVAAPPRSPLRSPRRLLETLSNKARPLMGKRSNDGGGFGYGDDEEGVWQRNILMGDKRRPLEFSGVIHYDSYGNSVAEMPRSPKVTTAAPPSPLRTFTFPVPKTSF